MLSGVALLTLAVLLLLLYVSAAAVQTCFVPDLDRSYPVSTCTPASGRVCVEKGYADAASCCRNASVFAKTIAFPTGIVSRGNSTFCGCAPGASCPPVACLTGTGCRCYLPDWRKKTCFSTGDARCFRGFQVFKDAASCCDGLSRAGAFRNNAPGVCGAACKRSGTRWVCREPPKEPPSAPRPLPKCSGDTALPPPQSVAMSRVAPRKHRRPGAAPPHLHAYQHSKCGTRRTHESNAQSRVTGRATVPPTQIVVHVAWHIVTTRRRKYDLTKEHIDMQMRLLNARYNRELPANLTYRFVLSSVQRWSDDKAATYALCGDLLYYVQEVDGAWLSDAAVEAGVQCQQEWIEYMSAHTPGRNASTLLIITANLVPVCGLYGQSRFPWDYGDSPGQDATLFSTELAQQMKDTTIPHEVGHWLGLLHTFQTTDAADAADLFCYPGTNKDVRCCNFVDDEVKDTPRVNPTDGRGLNWYPCIKQKDWKRVTAPDTCPKHPGRDLVNNIMDYTLDEDGCIKSFTRGQHERIRSMWAKYRMHAA